MRAVGVAGKKVGARAKVLSDCHRKRKEAGTASQGRKAQRISLVYMWLHNEWRRNRFRSKVPEDEGTEDYHSLASTCSAEAGQGSEIFTPSCVAFSRWYVAGTREPCSACPNRP